MNHSSPSKSAKSGPRSIERLRHFGLALSEVGASVHKRISERRLFAFGLIINLLAGALWQCQMVCQAAEDAVSDKADWVKKNLAALDVVKKRPDPAYAELGIAPLPKTHHLLKAPYLPTAAELRAQEARLDNSYAQARPFALQNAIMDQSNEPLTGHASYFNGSEQAGAFAQAYNLCRSAQKKYGMAASRRLPYGSLAQRQKHNVPMQARGFKPAYHIPPEQMIRQAAATLPQAPIISPDEKQMIDSISGFGADGNAQAMDPEAERKAQAQIRQLEQDLTAERHDTAGPPPFPLNLIPRQALQDIIGRGHHRRMDVPPAYFGSWHQASAASSLPKSGFRSYVNRTRLPYAGFPRLAQQGTSQRFRIRHVRPSLEYSLAKVQAPAQVLVYPPYENSAHALF